MRGDFLDSNVLLYLFDDTDSRKRRIAERLVETALREGTGWISFQVVQEVLNVLTRGFNPPADSADARRLLDDVLSPLWRVMPNGALYHQALEVRERYSYSFYDSLIVAAALESACERLYSEDLQNGQRIGDLTISDPFS
jgi:predicted nucleic acid-binding protein